MNMTYVLKTTVYQNRTFVKPLWNGGVLFYTPCRSLHQGQRHKVQGHQQ